MKLVSNVLMMLATLSTGVILFYVVPLFTLNMVIPTLIVVCFVGLFWQVYNESERGLKYWFTHATFVFFILTTPDWGSYVFGERGGLGLIKWPTERQQIVLDSLYKRSESLWAEVKLFDSTSAVVGLGDKNDKETRRAVMHAVSMCTVDSASKLHQYIVTGERHNSMLDEFHVSFYSRYTNGRVILKRTLKGDVMTVQFWFFSILFFLVSAFTFWYDSE